MRQNKRKNSSKLYLKLQRNPEEKAQNSKVHICENSTMDGLFFHIVCDKIEKECHCEVWFNVSCLGPCL